MVNMIAALSKVMMGGGGSGGAGSAEDKLLNLTMLRQPPALRQGTIDEDALGHKMTILPRTGSKASLAKAVSFREPASPAASGAGARPEYEAENEEEDERDGENKEDANDEVLPPAPAACALRASSGSSPIPGRDNAKRGRSVEDTTALIAKRLTERMKGKAPPTSGQERQRSQENSKEKGAAPKGKQAGKKRGSAPKGKGTKDGKSSPAKKNKLPSMTVEWTREQVMCRGACIPRANKGGSKLPSFSLLFPVLSLFSMVGAFLFRTIIFN